MSCRTVSVIGVFTCVLVLASLDPAAYAQTTISVTTTADELDGDPGNGDCSLREAIANANDDNGDQADCDAGSGADTVDVPAGTYVLTRTGTREDANVDGDLDILDDLTLIGAGAASTILDGNDDERVLQILGHLTVSLSDLTVRNGHGHAHPNCVVGFDIECGGGILAGKAAGAFPEEQGVPVELLTLLNVAITDNRIDGVQARGGGLVVYGRAKMVSGLIANNSSGAAAGGAAFGRGGPTGLPDVIELVNTTFSGNTAETAPGGAIWTYDAEVTLRNSTVTGNSAEDLLVDPGSTLYATGNGAIRFANTVIGGNDVTAECTNDQFDELGEFESLDGNVVADTSCQLDQPNDQPSSDPLLYPLADGGGATATHAIDAASPAFNAGVQAVCDALTDADGNPLTTDQRGAGFSRSSRGGRCDVGAFELQVAVGGAEVVESLADDTLAGLDGNFVCDLREAIAATLSGAITGECAPAPGNQITFLPTLHGTVTMAGEPFQDVTGELGIDGAHSITLDADGASRHFAVIGGSGLSLGGLTLTGGNATGESDPSGGSIRNQGELSIVDSTLRGNTSPGAGGAIVNDTGGSLTIARSTISGNTGSRGGGIQNLDAATLTHATVSGNVATTGGGGGLSNESEAALIGVTIAANVGGGLRNSGTATLANTLVTGSTGGPNCDDGSTGATTWQGMNNLDGDGTCAAILPAGFATGDADLGPLTDNGGTTLTHALGVESEALEAGDPSTCDAIDPDTDQRGTGFPRTAGDACDIGAYELAIALDGPDAVQSLADGTLANLQGNGTCDLREAIEAALTGTVVGECGVPGGRILAGDIAFVTGLSGTLTMSSGRFQDVTGELTIDGHGLVTLDAAGASRHFYVPDGGDLGIAGLSLINGSAPDGDPLGGGAIFNEGELSLVKSTIAGNSAENGGGIFTNQGSFSASNSTISGNVAEASGDAGFGGGIFHASGDKTLSMTLTNVTISGNTATLGGGIAIASRKASLTNVTVVDNTGGGLLNQLDISLVNTVVTGSIDGPDCSDNGTVGESWLVTNSLHGDGSCLQFSLTFPTGDADLGPLTENGGPTETHALLGDSDAIDAGDQVACDAISPNTDQRGELRTALGGCDIGTYEARHAPALAFAPGGLVFADVDVGATGGPQSTTLWNTGDVDATGLAFPPLGNGFAADTTDCGGTLAVGASCEIGVTFTPAEPGAAAAALQVETLEGAFATAALSGNGIGDGGFTPIDLQVDPAGLAPEANGVFEPGEAVDVAPAWRNDGGFAQSVGGTATDFAGPDGAIHTIDLDGADYGLIEPGGIASCLETELCYRFAVDDPAVRPATHWEAAFEEALDDLDGTAKTWTLHIGNSFADVLPTHLFYSAIETLLHSGVTAGCTPTAAEAAGVPAGRGADRETGAHGRDGARPLQGGAAYCPGGANSRSQMPVFMLRALMGPDYTPPPCVEGDVPFGDVPFDSPFCPWIQDLADRDIVSGCGDDDYCPSAPVSRAQMAIFILRTLEGAAYEPPACANQFTDVPCPSLFADWIEELAERGITGGCTADEYCSSDAVTRAQMAVFITKAFGFTLYGP